MADLHVLTSTAFTSLQLDGSRLRVGPMSSKVSGAIALSPAVSWSKASLDTTEPFSVRALAALRPGDRLPIPEGRLELQLRADGDMDKNAADLSAKWTGFSYAQESLTVRGAFSLKAKVFGATRTPNYAINADLSPLAMVGSGFQKGGGDEHPDRGERRVDRSGPAALEGGDPPRFPGGHDRGGIYPLGSKGKVDFGVSLGELALAPFLNELKIPTASIPKGSKLGMKMRYQASAASPAAGSLQIPTLTFAAGRSQLTANASVQRFSPLRMRAVARSPYLDLDALLGTSEGVEARP